MDTKSDRTDTTATRKGTRIVPGQRRAHHDRTTSPEQPVRSRRTGFLVGAGALAAGAVAALVFALGSGGESPQAPANSGVGDNVPSGQNRELPCAPGLSCVR